MMNFRALLAITLLTISAFAFSDTRLPHIVILATGGTIAGSAASNTQTTGYKAGAIGVQTLINAVPEMSKVARVDGEQVANIGSENMTSDIILKLSKRVNELLARDDVDGVVITHGTDTMAYTASALSFMLAGIPKPVILTGSQLPLFHPLTDARGNLRRAVAAATLGMPGVYVSFDYKLISGVRCVKTHTTAMNAFSSINAPLAGYFDVEGLHMDHPQAFTPTPQMGAGYCLRDGLDPRVFLLKLVPGTSPEVLRFIRDAGYRGLVIEAFGLGGLHYIRRNLVAVLRELAESGVYVLVVSQCLHEKADLTVYEVGRGMMHRQVHSGRDMTTEAAVTKLMWALAQENPEELLGVPIVGEMTRF